MRVPAETGGEGSTMDNVEDGADGGRPMSGATRGVARTADGIDLHYTLRGETGADASGRPRVALIHSLALNEGVWEPVAERLVARADVLTYDCRGHGASTPAPGPYSLALFADDLAAVLDAVGWPTAAVAGASMGGMVAQAFATSRPERVTALGLVDTTAWYGADAARSWEERAIQAADKGFDALIDFQLSRWFSDEFRAEQPDLVARFTRDYVANDLGCFQASCRMLGAFDLREAVVRLTMPTAVIVGEQDFATPPEMARDLHQRIDGSSLHILPNTRHLSPLERPAESLGILGDLLDRTAVARG